MKSLLQYLRGYKKECILGPLFKMLEACFDLTVPYVTALMIDQGIANHDTGRIGRYSVMLILLAMIDHRTVFCGKGGSRFCNEIASCTVFPYRNTVF